MFPIRSVLPILCAAVAAAITFSGTAEAKRRVLGERVLEQGMRGTDVRVLQDYLTQVGHPTHVDGRFGPGTARRVRAWERRAGLRPDARVTRRDARLLRRAAESPTAASEPGGAEAQAPTAKAVIRDGLAIAPASAPPRVKAMIEAGNRIAKKPYRYGGGHGRWEDDGYDCSGSMSYAFHGAGMLDRALDSSGFARWGRPGKGRWVTVYANSGHSYMVVAGLRFDTSGRRRAGTRWHATMRSARGYTVRHPAGL